jgi:hypothetical protein
MTAQVSEVLEWNGKQYQLYSEPFRSYQKQNMHLKERFLFIPKSSSCWRGYRAKWKIEEGRLYLVSISGWVAQSKGPPRFYRIKEVMGTRDPVFAEWFTGTLIVPDGKMLQYVHMPYASNFERELRVVVVRGLILND